MIDEATLAVLVIVLGAMGEMRWRLNRLERLINGGTSRL
jgi:hypothetical protein